MKKLLHPARVVHPPGSFVLFFILLMAIPFVSLAQERTLEGTVVDATSQPLKGVSVTIANTKRGVTTDDNGRFSLKVTAGASITFSFSGFVAQTIKVPATGDVSIRLEVSQKAMDEVVVIGYGQVRKKDLTGSITQIRPEKISDQNPNTTQDIIRGTPGVTVGFDATAKGGGSIQIRGQRSVYTDAGHNDPLLVLDGMIFYGELSEINPDDIEQIDILKDASAAAVYGAKSANGVVIITTKKGKKGKPRFNFTSNYGISTMGINRRVMSPSGYMQYRHDWYTAPTYGANTTTGNYEAYQSDKKTQPGYYDEPTDANLSKWGINIDQWRAYTTATNGTAGDQEIWAKRLLLQGTVLNNYLAGKTFDWYNNTFRTGNNQDYNISASGGSDNYNYYMSMGYLSNQGLIKGNDFKAVRSNIKLEAKMTKWLDISGNINFQHRNEGDSAADWNRAIIYNSPYANYKDDTGALVVHPMGENSVNNYGYNYDFIRQYTARDKAYTVLNTIFTARVKLPFNITYSFNASPRYQFYHERYFESSKNPDFKGTNGLVYREQTERFDWSLNNTINWDQTFGKHRLNITLVQEAEKRQQWKDRTEARNILPSDALGYHETFFGDKNKSSYDADDVKETADGLLARLIYTYNDRYMFTASFRRDGYSAFGTSNPRANFISTAVAWTFTNEKFFKWESMSMGKLRLSWGQNGNRSLSDPYLALSNLTAPTTGSTTMGYLDNSGNLVQYRYLRIDRLANPNLHWEKTESFNTGIDFGFLNNRLTGSIDYYITPTIDMIMNRALPSFTGFTSITMNLGKVMNKGMEISLSSQNVRTKNFTWSTSFGFSKYKNTIKHLYYIYDAVLDAQGNVVSTKERDDIKNSWFIGQPVSAIWNYNVTGIWQASEAAEASSYGQRPGDPKVANSYTDNDTKDASGKVTPVYDDKDKQFLGQTNAPIMWSLRNDFTWKDFNFSFNLYSYWGNKSLVNLYLNQDNNTSLITNLANTWQKNYWTLEHPTNNVARLDAKGPAGVQAPGKLYDRSFIRLDNITVGYNVPLRIISKAHLDKLKVYANIRNAALWKKDKNWIYGDVETFTITTDNQYRNSLAPRIITFGLNVNF